MDTSTTENDVVIDTNEGEGETSNDTVSISKSEYEKLNQTLGSYKRELKDLRKAKEDSSKETSKTNAKSDNDSSNESKLLERLEKVALRQANITHEDDIALAKLTAKKWNVDLEDVLSDEDFKIKLERNQRDRDNALATSNIKGSAGSSNAKNTPEYWIAKGIPPSRTDVPDRKTRAQIARALMASTKSNKTFYND